MVLDLGIKEATKRVRASQAEHRSKAIEDAMRKLVRLGFYEEEPLTKNLSDDDKAIE